MASNLERYRSDLDKLILLGDKIYADLYARQEKTRGQQTQQAKRAVVNFKGIFETEYQQWFTESLEVMKQLLPDRVLEFSLLYKGDGKRKNITSMTYCVQDWMLGIRSNIDAYGKQYFDDFSITVMRFCTQLDILKSILKRFESTLFDIRQLLRADLFDSELDIAKDMHKNGFLRAAGSIAGVILEKHLLQVCTNHAMAIKKKNPTISDFNDALKDSNVIDVPTWRHMQRLGDIRNVCSHNKQREPKTDEVEEMIIGVDKIIKTLY